MNYLWKLAFKNILRSKWRTVLTFLILSFAVAMYVLLASLLAGFDKASIKSVIDFETGHYQIRSMTFTEEQPFALKYYFGNVPAIRERLKKLDFVTGIAERVNFLAELDNGIDVTPVVVVGIGPQDNTVFSLEQYISEGGLEKGGVLIGKSLAENMGLKRDDWIYLTFRDQQGMLTSMEMLITGLVHSVNPQVNNSMVFMNLDEAQEYLGTNQVAEIAIKTNAFFKIKVYEPQIKAALENMKIFSWQELSKNFTALMTLKRKFQSVFLLILTIIAAVGIVNTMLMSVYEKRVEIGTMKALGFTDEEVRNLFIIEGFLIGLAGAITGLILGSLLNTYFVYVGVDYTRMMGEDQGFGMPVVGVVKSAWIFSAYFKALALALIASVLASYYPAKKVTRMEPMECLRTV